MAHARSHLAVAAALAAGVVMTGCDRQTGPVPERKVEQRAAEPARAERQSAGIPEGRPTVMADSHASRPLTDAPSRTQPATQMATQSATPSAAESAQARPLNDDERRFVSDVAGAGLYQVESGRMAISKATTAGVRALGKRLEAQHRAANAELQVLANARGVTLPTAVPPAQREELQRMSELIGPTFDSEFTQTVGIAEHEASIEKFAAAGRDAQDPQLRAWIDKTLPLLHQELNEARQLVAAR